MTAAACTANAAEPAAPKAVRIAAGSLDRALQDYARQTHRQLLYRSTLVAGESVNALSGTFTPDDALRRLLAGTAIVFHSTRGNVVVLDRAPPLEPHHSPSVAPPKQAPDRIQVPPPGNPTAADIIVTGSHIRGRDAGGMPVTVITRTDLDRLGRATLAEAFATLPANFTGAASEQSALTLADGSGTNASLATGVNLRGLGAGATLVLVNGRRLAGSGTLGEFGDISSIPSSVVDRVEILLDGASAIYGSDAVGGVVNIILKDRYRVPKPASRPGWSRTAAAVRFRQARRWERHGPRARRSSPMNIIIATRSPRRPATMRRVQICARSVEPIIGSSTASRAISSP
ncbi:TonB-dependent receptor [Polymorphobacter sp. PAMC 29334]|uniref:TonB-dependent receptor n=1 Tax=Polymorphobacter sp. PAMC 29334 TaxID=2862331 RepID=UPI001D02EDF3|nr:TonB-dependent receptor [Polymorphobacter sp. PAMC 29334]